MGHQCWGLNLKRKSSCYSTLQWERKIRWILQSPSIWAPHCQTFKDSRLDSQLGQVYRRKEQSWFMGPPEIFCIISFSYCLPSACRLTWQKQPSSFSRCVPFSPAGTGLNSVLHKFLCAQNLRVRSNLEIRSLQVGFVRMRSQWIGVGPKSRPEIQYDWWP